MQNRCWVNSRVSVVSLFFLAVFSCLPGQLSSAVVTLHSIKIYVTHDWFKTKPTIYFHCQGENKTILPDVKEKNVLYTFKGEESWQPLTELESKKCKRCGIYDEDLFGADDTFDEWELCPADFTEPDGNYTRFKEKEFNATFFCPECSSLVGGQPPPAVLDSNLEEKKFPYAVVILSSVAASTFVIVALIFGYKYWLKRKRQQEQARFLQLFEESDEIEDELGLHHVV